MEEPQMSDVKGDIPQEDGRCKFMHQSDGDFI
jgi:hypothetical protein